MEKLYLAFCPYIPTNRLLHFSDWHLGPVEEFDDRWPSRALRTAAETFLSRFVDNSSKRIQNPALLVRKEQSIGGKPTDHEIQALQAAITFSFIDRNKRNTGSDEQDGWSMVTADNTELHVWPINLESGHVTITSGAMVRVLAAGYRINDPKLIVRPPVDLHMPLGASADRDCMEAVYETVLSSLKNSLQNVHSDHIRVAIAWLARAWQNTASVGWAERIVYLKTGFEALTGTSASPGSARNLRTIFENLKGAASPEDAEELLWSPVEKPVHQRTYRNKGKDEIVHLTDLEEWFLEFSRVRNSIIHDGLTSREFYRGPAVNYVGDFLWTAEFLLRASIKISLAQVGYPNLWRSELWRTVDAAMGDFGTRRD